MVIHIDSLSCTSPPHFQQLLKQVNFIFFHLAGIEEFLVILKPITVFPSFFGSVAEKIAAMDFNEIPHFLIFR